MPRHHAEPTEKAPQISRMHMHRGRRVDQVAVLRYSFLYKERINGLNQQQRETRWEGVK